ncbi:MAG: 4Fe-4S binding protein [Kiritimatiellia bacterium]|nr:4Fe-4S binding protein [Lentisphaerota bacterium]
MQPKSYTEPTRAELTAEIKKYTKTLGADLVGIASMDRFDNAPKQMDPRYIMPEAKSCIVVGFRVLRGSLRGIEEGTFFSNYSSMGYGGITYVFMPSAVVNLSRYIEDMGYEAFPMGHQSDWRAIDNEGRLRTGFSKPVAPDKPAPDIMVHLRLAAFAAGLGEIGWSKMLITPEFGPALRVGLVLTEMDLEPDPIYSGPKLCNKCMACVRACPGQAISATSSVKVTVAGHELEWGEIDLDACDVAFRGAEESQDPDRTGHYIKGSDRFRPNHISPFFNAPPKVYGAGKAVCGAGGCTRACLASLEARDVLSHKFKQKFRRRKPWTVDWSNYEGEIAQLPRGTVGINTRLDTD